MAQFLKTTTTAASPVSLTAITTNFHQATIIARKSLDGSAGGGVNAGSVYLGYSSAAGEQPLELTPGDQVLWKGPGNGKGMDDLKNIFLTVANNGDGVVVIYT